MFGETTLHARYHAKLRPARRLAWLLIVPCLLLLATVSVAHASAPAQETPPDLLPRPVQITVQQQLPLSITLTLPDTMLPAGSSLASTDTLTATLAATPLRTATTLTPTAPLTVTQPITLDISFQFFVTEPITGTLLDANTGSPTQTITSTATIRLLDASGAQEAITSTVGSTETVSLVTVLTATRTTTDSSLLTDSDALTSGDALTNAEELTDTEELTGAAATTDTEETARTPSRIRASSADDLLEDEPFVLATFTVPVTITLGTLPDAIFSIAPLDLSNALTTTDGLTATSGLTEAGELTDTDVLTAADEITATAAPTAAEVVSGDADITGTQALTETDVATDVATDVVTGGDDDSPAAEIPSISGRAVITVNLRAGPGLDFDVVGQAGADQPVEVVAQNIDGTWYLLDSGQWVATDFVAEVAPAPPIASDALIAQVQANAAAGNAEPAAEEPPADDVPADDAPADDAPADDAPADDAPADDAPAPPTDPPTPAVDANLRAGPGIAFDVTGGTVAGQPITIVGRTDAGDWFLLDNGGWIFVDLITNAPAIEDVPVVDETGAVQGQAEAPPEADASEVDAPDADAPDADVPDADAPDADAPDADATEVDVPAATQALPLTATEIDYVDGVNDIQRSFDFAFSEIERLISEVGQDPSLVEDGDWSLELSTAIAILRITAREVDALEPPDRFAGANVSLVEAAGSYRSAADLIGDGVADFDTDIIASAIEQIQAGSIAFERAREAISAESP